MNAPLDEPNLRSDVEAKAAFALELRQRGFVNVRIKAGPADLIADRSGVQHYFEVKFTRQDDHYFGAATLTEWEAAMENPERFWFVVAWKAQGAWCFKEYTPAQFMAFSSIPPFKIFFNVPIGDTQPRAQKKIKTAVGLTLARLTKLAAIYREFRTQNKIIAAGPGA